MTNGGMFAMLIRVLNLCELIWLYDISIHISDAGAEPCFLSMRNFLPKINIRVIGR